MAILVYYIFIKMKKSQNSSFLLTEQSRYSEDLFTKSINRVRKRINILSTTSVRTEHLCPEEYMQSKPNKASGLVSTLAKLTFDAEMLEQDVRAELLDLKVDAML